MRELLVGLLIMAVGASAKSIIDVARLETDNKNIKELLLEVRHDVKTLLKEK